MVGRQPVRWAGQTSRLEIAVTTRSARSVREAGRLTLCCAAVLVAGAAGATAAVGAGRTDRLDGAPFYRSYQKHVPEGAVVTLPVRLDPGAVGDFGNLGRPQALRVLLEALNGHLVTLEWARPLDVELPEDGAPQVYVGSADGEHAPAAAAMEMGGPDERAPMVIHLQFPSKAWRQAAGTVLSGQRAQCAIVLTLGFSEFSKSYKGTFKKRVVLGTGYETDIRFLSAELEPVHVLCLTGALVDLEGKVIRAGAEGILSEDTPFWAQSISAQKEIDTDMVLRLLEEERREDLPGHPLTWQVALENLVAQLLGEASRVIQ